MFDSGGFFYASRAATWRVSLDLYRAAALIWITPFFTVLSMIDCAGPKRVSASVLVGADSTFLKVLRSNVRTPLFRTRAFSDWRNRFFDEANFGKLFTPLHACGYCLI